jgi:hypothetical protein
MGWDEETLGEPSGVVDGDREQSEGAMFLAEDRPFCPNFAKIRLGFRITFTCCAGLAGEGAGSTPRFPATSDVRSMQELF